MAYFSMPIVGIMAIVTGIAMLLAGIGLGILALFVFGALKDERRESQPAGQGAASGAAA